MDSHLLRELLLGLKVYYHDAEETEKIILDCALVAAGVDALGGLIPVLAIPAAITSCFGAVWVMYGKLCSKLGIRMSENVLKLLARAALANIAANLGSVLIALVVGMLIPGAAIAASAITVFLTVWLAGYIFLQLILKLAQKSKDPYTFSDISTGEMKQTVKEIKVDKQDLEAAKHVFEEHKNDLGK